jgi:hypothetical protein
LFEWVFEKESNLEDMEMRLNRISEISQTRNRGYLSNLVETVNKHHFIPDRMFNIHDTGIITVNKP